MDLRGIVRSALLIAGAVGAAFTGEPTWKSGATTVTLSPDGTLRVSGNGAMDDYKPSEYTPWRAGWCGDDGPCYGYDELPIAHVIIEDGVTSIGKNAFAAIRGLTSVAIPNSVTSIGESAFIRCYGLTSVTIPGSAASIGNAAFHACRNLTSVTIGNGVKSIGENAFSLCIGLTSVAIPGSVVEIGWSAFDRCENLAFVTIEDGVKSIGNYAFMYCTDLVCITIPRSVTEIGEGVFDGADNLKVVTVLSAEPPKVNTCPYSGSNWGRARLYIPAGSLDAYLSSDWHHFHNIDEIAEATNGVWLALSGILTALILSAAVFVIIRRLRKSSRKEVV